VSHLVQLLVSATGLSEPDVRSILRNAPLRYKTYFIPKRNGGVREISQPAKELKLLQRAFCDHFLKALPIHGAAKAYVAGASIRDNAEAHVENGPILKFDFRNFFPSLTARDWVAYCYTNDIFQNEEDLKLSSNLLFHKKNSGSVLRLAIGAPSSPLLSNIIMYEFDRNICNEVASHKVTYTRYADDLTFSAKRTGYLNCVEKILRGIILKMDSPRLKINDEKTVLATKKYKRNVTGLILTNDNKISIGHERKREIRAAVHHAKTGDLSTDMLLNLSGLLAFVYDVEPEFYWKMVDRYGLDVINKIKSTLRG
jgi:retron-type reverse transcriptase